MAKNWKHKLAVFNTRYQKNIELMMGAFIGAAFTLIIKNNTLLWIFMILVIVAFVLNKITERFTFKNCPYCGKILKR